MNRRQPARDITTPEPGLFSLRLVKGGPPVAARIVRSLGMLSAEINGAPASVEEVWEAGIVRHRGRMAPARRQPARPIPPCPSISAH